MSAPIWNLEQVQRLSPSTLTFERATKIAKASRWRKLQRSGTRFCGECRTSGATNYRVAIQVDSRDYYSNSPAAEKPDKYIIALALLTLQDEEAFAEKESLPQWVEDGFSRKASSTSAVDKAKDRARQQEKRISSMTDGVQELQAWLLDRARRGLAELQQQDQSYWEQFASRMTDYKLGSIANRIRRMADYRLRSDWAQYLTSEVADLYLFAQAFQQLDELDEPLQQELLSLGGYNFKKKDLLTQSGQRDHWMILSLITGEDEKLRFRRTWVWGQESQGTALLLDFVFGNGPFEQRWQFGHVFEGELIYYPGPVPQRALVKDYRLVQRQFSLQGFADHEAMLQAFAKNLGQNPWLRSIPAGLEWVVPARTEQQMVLVDQQQRALPTVESEATWTLLALAAGQPVFVFGEWDGALFHPLSTVVGGRLLQL